jgi:hypothetical protein
MELVIPDGTQVYITVGQPPLFALPHESNAAAPQPARSSGRIVKTLLAGVLLIGAFQAGRFLPHHPDIPSAAQPASAAAVLGMAGSGAAGEIPAAFRAQVVQPPQVIPPPGAAPVAAPGGSVGGGAAPATAPSSTNPFGLQG